jgi:hypothetical protein
VNCYLIQTRSDVDAIVEVPTNDYKKNDGDLVEGDQEPTPWKPNLQKDTELVQPLLVRIQVHVGGRTEALLFNVERLVSGCRMADLIKLHKGYLHTYPDTFSGPAMLDWVCSHAGNALFGQQAVKAENQKIAKYVAQVLSRKMLTMGVFRQVKGSPSKGFEDPISLYQLHEDDKNKSNLNSNSIWFKSSRDPHYVVAELLYKMINIRLKHPDKDLCNTEDLKTFTSASAELQFVNINDMSRQKIISFYLNAYNLMVLHAHAVLGCVEGTDFSSQKSRVKHEFQYKIAAYNYTLAEIEERLLNRVMRGQYPKTSDKARAPERRVHFALSLVMPKNRFQSHNPDIDSSDWVWSGLCFIAKDKDI